VVVAAWVLAAALFFCLFCGLLQKGGVEFVNGLQLPWRQAHAVELLPGPHVGVGNAFRGRHAAAALLVQSQKGVPHLAGVRRQGRQVQLRRALACGALGGQQVVFLGAAIGFPGFEGKQGLGVANERAAQALVKTSTAFMLATSWRTIHWRLGSR